MNTKTILIIASAAFATVIMTAGMTSCSQTVPSSAVPDPSTQDPTDSTPVTTKDKVVFVPDYNDFEIDIQFEDSAYAIFHLGNEDSAQRGVINIYGNVVYEPDDRGVNWCPIHGLMFASGDDGSYVIDNNYIISEDQCGHGLAFIDNYIYEEKTGTFYYDTTELGGGSISKISPSDIPTFTPYLVYTGDHTLSEGDYGISGEDSPRDVIERDLAMTDIDNNYVIAEHRFFDENRNIISLGRCDRYKGCYLGDEVYPRISNGYFRVTDENGMFTFYNTKGERCSELYDDAANAYDGKAWVKRDEKWMIISLR